MRPQSSAVRLNYGREETPVFEFPITIEDELERPMTSRLPAAMDILKKLASYSGTCVVLMHTDVFDDKFAFLEALVPKAKEMGAWFGTVRGIGEWWAARNAVQVDVMQESGKIVMTAELVHEFSDIAFDIPTAWRLDTSAPDSHHVLQSRNKVVMKKLARELRLVFHTR